jgi:predicted transcriptional regulator
VGYAKLTVNLSDDLIRVLEDLANARGTTQTEVLRQAISTEAQLQAEVNQGSKILIEDSRGRTRQLLMREAPGLSFGPTQQSGR